MSVDSLVLPNTFILEELSERAIKILRRSKAGEILEVIKHWAENPADAPPSAAESSEEDQDQDEDELVAEASQELNNMISDGSIEKYTRQQLIQLIVEEFWRDGLNLYQIADVDTRSLFNTRNSNPLWTYARLQTANGDDHIPRITPEVFLENLEKAIYPLYLGHMYITSKQDLALVVVRIQIFSPKPRQTGPLMPEKPIYFALPSSSPNFLYTRTNSTYSKALEMALEKSLAQPGSPVVTMHNSEIVTSSLKTLSFLKGGSKYPNALGAWSIYAKNLVDNSPLNNHRKSSSKSANSGKDPASKRRKIANMKFTGTDDSRADYKSANPHDIFEVKLVEKLADHSPEVTLRFEGEDVFAGIHKLATQGTIEAKKMPNWLTGEEPHTAGVVSGGIFSSR